MNTFQLFISLLAATLLLNQPATAQTNFFAGGLVAHCFLPKKPALKFTTATEFKNSLLSI